MLKIVAEKNNTVVFIRKHTRFDNQFKEVVIQSDFVNTMCKEDNIILVRGSNNNFTVFKIYGQSVKP